MRAQEAEALGDGEEHRDGLGPDLQGEDLADGQVARAGAGRSEEEDHRPAQGLGGRIEGSGLEQLRGDDEQDAGHQVGAGDHLAAADGVEQPADGQRAKQVPGGEGHEVVGGVGGLDVEEELQDQAVGEEDRVVQERLGDHQGRAEHRPGRVMLEQGAEQGQVADPLGRPDLQFPARVDRRERALGLGHVVLDLGDGGFGFFLVAVHDLPAGAFRQVPPDVDDDQGQYRADHVGDPPASARGQVVQRGQGDDGAQERPGPVRPVHG